MSTPQTAALIDPQTHARHPWLRRLGAAGFAFFLIKGLLWIILPILAARGIIAANDRQPSRPADARLVTD